MGGVGWFTDMELGRREVGDVVVDGDLDDALHRHDRRCAHVVRRRRDRPRVPVPLRVLPPPRRCQNQNQIKSNQIKKTPARAEGRASAARGGSRGRRRGVEMGCGEYRELGGHAERADGAAGLGEGDARAGEGQRVEGAAVGAVEGDAGFLQPLPGTGGHPRRGRRRRRSAAAHAGARLVFAGVRRAAGGRV